MSKPKPQPQKKSTPYRQWLGPALMGAGLLLVGLWIANQVASNRVTAGPAGDPAQIALGRQLYQANCAGCHGPNGEGQPNWKFPDANGVYPAPPHNSDGHTWHHADQDILSIIAQGGSLPNSIMPTFKETLTQAEMEAVLVYLKTFWGPSQRQFQAEVTQSRGG